MTEISNPYAAPEAKLLTEEPGRVPDNPTPIYTPFQVRLASFLGGPYAVVYTLYQNFKRLKNTRGMQLTLFGGIAFNALLLALITVLPEQFPKQLIPFAYSWAAGGIASSNQLTKEQIKESAQYQRRSGWNVAAVTVISILAFCLITFPAILLLDYLGVIHIA